MTTTIRAAINAIQEEVRAVGKDDRNAQQGFNFRGIDATVNALAPSMRKHGVVVVPHLVSLSRGHAQTSKGATMNTVDVIVDYTFHGPEGDSLTARTPGEAFDSGDKATAKAMSVAYRTALLQTFSLPTQDIDPDAEINQAVPQRDWQGDLNRALQSKDIAAMTLLRRQAAEAQAPEWYVGTIDAALADLERPRPEPQPAPEDTPIEGNVTNA